MRSGSRHEMQCFFVTTEGGAGNTTFEVRETRYSNSKVDPKHFLELRSVYALLLPPAAKRPVKLHEALIFAPSCLRQAYFRGETRSLAVQHFEVGGRASLVAHVGEVDRLVQVGDLLLLVDSNLVEFLVCDQSVGYIPEGMLNGFPVGEQGLLVLRFGKAKIPSKGAPQ